MYIQEVFEDGEKVILPKIPISVNTAIMTDEEIHEKLQRGYTDAEAGNVRSAAEVFAKFRENHQMEYNAVITG